MQRIYLDYNASTPVAPEVTAAMQALLADHYGNPSSGHWASRGAHDALEGARAEVAALLGARPSEIVFTSGGSESNNAAIKGVAFARLPGEAHLVISAVEHPSVRQTCRYLERFGVRTTEVPVDRTGRIDPQRVADAITPHTVLVSVMHANNEVGTLQPIAEVARHTRERGVVFHCDAAQSIGKLPIDVGELGVDLLTVAGHKAYAPKGVGALFVRDGIELDPLIHGAGHERGRRAGTESALLATALGAACRLARLEPCGDRLLELRERMWTRLRETFGDTVALHGHPHERLPNTLNVGFSGRTAAEILERVPALAASAGAACHAGSRELSPVLSAMGVDPRFGLGAIRFSVGRPTTAEEIDGAVEYLRDVL
jgi:cysteine desulfurase